MDIAPHAGQKVQARHHLHDEYRRYDLRRRQKQGERCDGEKREAEPAIAAYDGGAEDANDRVDKNQYLHGSKCRRLLLATMGVWYGRGLSWHQQLAGEAGATASRAF